MKKCHTLAALALCAGTAAANADTVELSFYRITSNSGVNIESQLHCVMSEVNPTTVSFKFTNAVGVNSSVTEVYFDDGPFLQVAPTILQFGTNFTGGGANPPNLPGGETLSPPFNATQIFSADATGNPSNGISTASDWLDMHFTLVSGKTFQDVVDALISGEMRVGMHVRSIGPSQDSDGFVNNPLLVPLPASAWAGIGCMAGIGGIRAIRRRRGI
jgi:hypothetical protein